MANDFRQKWNTLVATAIETLDQYPLPVQWDRSALSKPDFLKQVEDDIFEPVRLLFEGCQQMDTSQLKEFDKTVVAKIQVKLLVEQERSMCAKELSTVQVVKPIFVVGLPRFGTTLLHNLLSQDESSRSLKLWELLFPGRLALLRQDRIKLAQERAARFEKLCAGFKALHLYDPLGPDDCNWSLDNNFVDVAMSCCLPRLNSYREWVLRNSHEHAYRFHKSVMQIAQLDSAPTGLTHFVMKSSAHFFWLNDLLKVFPDARIVWMHRDPVEALPSICKMHELMWNFYPYEPGLGDKKWLGAHMLEFMATEIECAFKHRENFVRSTGKSAQFYDVCFSDLVEDPHGTVHRLYDHFGMEYPYNMNQSIHKWLQDNPRDKYGSNVYTAEEFGLDEQQMRSRFKHYIERYMLLTRPPRIATPQRQCPMSPSAEDCGF